MLLKEEAWTSQANVSYHPNHRKELQEYNDDVEKALAKRDEQREKATHQKLEDIELEDEEEESEDE